MKAALSLCVTVLAAVAAAKDVVSFTIRSTNAATNGKKLSTVSTKEPFGGVNLGVYSSTSARAVRYSQHGLEFRDETGASKDDIVALVGWPSGPFQLVNIDEKKGTSDPKFLQLYGEWTADGKLVNANKTLAGGRLYAMPTFQGPLGDWDVIYSLWGPAAGSHEVDLIPAWQKV